MDQLSLFDYVNNKGDNKESTIETISNTSRSRVLHPTTVM